MPSLRMRLLLVLLLAAGAARAQKPIPAGEPPTRGVLVPVGAVAGDGEADMVEVNPANLGWLSSWNLQFIHTELDPDGVMPGRGDALYAASPLPYLSRLSLGVAGQSVRPPDGCAGPGVPCFPFNNVGKLTFALGLRVSPALSLGASYSHIFVGDTPNANGVDTIDLAATARLLRWLALGLVVRDATGPVYRGVPLQRVWEPELAVRPLGDYRFEMAIAARIGERRGDVDPRFRLQVAPIDGLILRGSLELVHDVDLDGRPENDLRATLGLELNLAPLGVGGYAHFGGTAGGSAWHGFSVTARVSGDRYPALWSPLRLEKIDLSISSDRQLAQTLTHLHQLEHDRRSDGVVLVMGDLSGSWATMEELRDALERLRHAGKHVFAYGAELNTKSYFVASAAERLYLDPSGGIRLVGFSSTALYFKGTFDLLGVQADFIKIAEYKSAPEQYTRTGPTEPARQERAAILDDTYAFLVGTLAAGRRMDAARVRSLIDHGPYTAEEAKKAGLVDQLVHGDEVEDAIGEILGRHVDAVDPDRRARHPKAWSLPAVAVIFIDGDIVDGKSRTIPILDMKLVGHQTIIQAITEARADNNVKAIVLRVDSPGGSALASDLIAREIDRTRKVKPVICSFGDVAASGGYFVAAGCDQIFADPSTVTGSIGIFTGKFDVSGLAHKIGVTFDVEKRGAHADIESYFRPYTDEERASILEKLRYYYGRFVDTVAEGRHLKPAQVDAIGRGHVWSGQAGRKNGLVDQIGGLVEALVYTKLRVGLGEWEPAELRVLPEEPTTLIGQIAQLLGIDVSERTARLPAVDAALRGLPGSVLADPEVPQARMEWTPARE